MVRLLPLLFLLGKPAAMGGRLSSPASTATKKMSALRGLQGGHSGRIRRVCGEKYHA